MAKSNYEQSENNEDWWWVFLCDASADEKISYLQNKSQISDLTSWLTLVAYFRTLETFDFDAC